MAAARDVIAVDDVAPTPAADDVAPTPAPDAELAAYRDARIAMRADLAAGLARLRGFVAAYPTSRFDAEARLSIIDCQVRLGRLAAAAPDVDAFLVRFPDSERTPEVRFVRAEILRTVHHRCDAARADYRVAATSSRVGDDARFFLGWCADAVGDHDERDRALAAYLAHAPAGRHATAAAALLHRP